MKQTEGFPNRQLLYPVCLLCAEKTHLILVIVTTHGLSYKCNSCSYNLQGICCVPVIVQDMLIREFPYEASTTAAEFPDNPELGPWTAAQVLCASYSFLSAASYICSDHNPCALLRHTQLFLPQELCPQSPSSWKGSPCPSDVFLPFESWVPREVCPTHTL